MATHDELQPFKHHLQMTFEHVPNGIYLYDHTGRILLTNALGARLLGFASVEEVLQTHNLTQMRERFYAHYRVEQEDGTPLAVEQGPVGRALHEQRDIHLVCHYFHLRSPAHFWAWCRATPIFDAHGQLTNVIYSITDITEHKGLEQRRDQFLSMVSHELNTPLTALAGLTHVLQRQFQQREDDPCLHLLNRMQTQITRLSRLMREVFEMSQMQTGELVSQEEPFDLGVLAQEMVEQVQATTLHHRLLLESAAKVRVLGDRDRMEYVLLHLLSNAIKYSRDAETVLVRVAIEAGQARLSVQDFGIGIADVYQQKIFERFYQVNDSEQLPFAGLGIGLSISSQIIKRHHGRLWVESTPGEGSTFHVCLPLLQDSERDQEEGKRASRPCAF